MNLWWSSTSSLSASSNLSQWPLTNDLSFAKDWVWWWGRCEIPCSWDPHRSGKTASFKLSAAPGNYRTGGLCVCVCFWPFHNNNVHRWFWQFTVPTRTCHFRRWNAELHSILPGTCMSAHECNIAKRNYVNQRKHYGLGQRNRFTLKSDHWVLSKKSTCYHHAFPVLNVEL